MSVRHELPSGGWVEIKEASELRAKDRKAVLRQIADPEEGHRMATVVSMTDLIAATVIIAWELPYLPGADIPQIQLDNLDELEILDENAVQAAIEPLVKLFSPQAPSPDDTENADGTPNLESPTVPSTA